MQDEVGAIVEGVITGIMDEVDKTTGAPTGRKKVELLTVGYQSTITEIQNVYVEKEYRGQGIGNKLMSRLISIAIENKVKGYIM